MIAERDQTLHLFDGRLGVHARRVPETCLRVGHEGRDADESGTHAVQPLLDRREGMCEERVEPVAHEGRIEDGVVLLWLQLIERKELAVDLVEQDARVDLIL